jgi:DNA-directed RNA polymerase sigma subunit (sigma70/sigma32)
MRKDTWKHDFEATDAEGNHLSVDSLPSPWTRTPEDIAILNQLARRLKYRLQYLGRDGKIFRKRLNADDTYAGGTLHGTSSASIAEETGLSRERVRQVIEEVGAGVRAWGEKIKNEAA